ncbi:MULTISPECIES: cation diffusion facilitator family transporter [Phenylobacterium]|uniref:Cation diffusion facilitator family transporter n=1 Tax=Phenylobacterium koreense TaxID=266125 RepID=A0ABV2EIJ3_9CAUL
MSDRPRSSVAEATALTRMITLASTGVALLLVSIKGAVWLLGGSTALLASAADSALDLLASLATFFAVRYAASPPDAEHRFGHGKAEAFASLLQGGLVFASAALIGREAIGDILHPREVTHGGLAIAVMAVSIALTFALIAAQTHVLKRTASVAVAGDRAHYATDLASNAVALLGVGAAAILGWRGVDAIAALAIAAFLVWGAVGVFREAANQLMDRELPLAERERIIALVTSDPMLSDVHQLRTRASGPYVHIQMHVDLDPTLSLRQAHAAVVAAERRILSEFPSADIIIHPDPRGAAEPHGGAFAETTLGKRGLKEG